MSDFQDDEYPVRGYGLPTVKLTCSCAFTALIGGMLNGGALPRNACTGIGFLILVAVSATLAYREFKASMK